MYGVLFCRRAAYLLWHSFYRHLTFCLGTFKGSLPWHGCHCWCLCVLGCGQPCHWMGPCLLCEGQHDSFYLLFILFILCGVFFLFFEGLPPFVLFLLVFCRCIHLHYIIPVPPGYLWVLVGLPLLPLGRYGKAQSGVLLIHTCRLFSYILFVSSTYHFCKQYCNYNYNVALTYITLYSLHYIFYFPYEGPSGYP